MGINEDLKDKAVPSRSCPAQSYKGGVRQEKRVTIPEKLPRDADADSYKESLHAQVKAVVNLLLMDRESVVQRVMKTQDELIRDNAKVILGDPASMLAPALAEVWIKEGIDLPNVDLYEGMCGYEKHAWFRASMPASLVHEPDYFYVIDPWGRGVSVISLSGHQSDIVVLKPWSPLHMGYAGKMVRNLALVEEGEEEGSSDE